MAVSVIWLVLVAALPAVLLVIIWLISGLNGLNKRG
jgi:hypothetical protein